MLKKFSPALQHCYAEMTSYLTSMTSSKCRLQTETDI